MIPFIEIVKVVCIATFYGISASCALVSIVAITIALTK